MHRRKQNNPQPARRSQWAAGKLGDKMKLYKLEIPYDQEQDYDTFDAFVIAADSIQEAINMAVQKESDFGKLKFDIEVIGRASNHITPGVILGSFNAG
jgi:hypothetical protein